jgi:hypothetical protein
LGHHDAHFLLELFRKDRSQVLGNLESFHGNVDGGDTFGGRSIGSMFGDSFLCK